VTGTDAGYKRVPFFIFAGDRDVQPVNIMPKCLGFLKINTMLVFVACAFSRIVFNFI